MNKPLDYILLKFEGIPPKLTNLIEMKKRSLLTLSAVLWAIIGTAQVNVLEHDHDRIPCGSAEANNLILDSDPIVRQAWNALNQLSIENEKKHAVNKSGPILYVIPVVYHVIYNSPSSNVSKAAIEASVQNLNEDFQKLNADISQVVPAFAGIAADIHCLLYTSPSPRD